MGRKVISFVDFRFSKFQQEENNNVPNGNGDDSVSSSNLTQKNAQAMLSEMRKYNIAAANPILAEKLSTPSEQNVQPHTVNGRPQLAPLTPKIEKG